MSDSDKEILKQALINLSQSKENKQTIPIGQIIGQLQHITQYLSHLENGVIKMAAEVQRVSLMNNMFASILIETGVIKEDELQQLYTERVYNPIKQKNDELQEQLKIQAEAERAVEEKEEEEKNDTSNIILASERFKKEEL